MTKPRAILYREFRDFLQQLGYKEKRTPIALVFQQPDEGLLAFRLYRDEEVVDARDLVTTRRFLDTWGLFDAAKFNAQFMQESSTA